MRTRNTKGFTLIELLIVIAIIGILAAVLIPQLMRARSVAVDRAAEGYAQNVYTAANAYMAENVTADATTTKDLDTDCSDGAVYGAYSTQQPSFTIGTGGCTVGANADNTDVTVSVFYDGGVNGANHEVTIP